MKTKLLSPSRGQLTVLPSTTVRARSVGNRTCVPLGQRRVNIASADTHACFFASLHAPCALFFFEISFACVLSPRLVPRGCWVIFPTHHNGVTCVPPAQNPPGDGEIDASRGPVLPHEPPLMPPVTHCRVVVTAPYANAPLCAKRRRYVVCLFLPRCSFRFCATCVTYLYGGRKHDSAHPRSHATRLRLQRTVFRVLLVHFLPLPLPLPPSLSELALSRVN